MFSWVFVVGCEAQQGNNDQENSNKENTEQSDQNSKTNMKEISYSYGVLMASSLKNQSIDGIDVDRLTEGIKDAMNGNDVEITQKEARQKVQTFMQKQQQMKQQKAKKKEEAFFAENAKKEGVKTTESGLQYKVLKEGSGPKPSKEDTVRVHYTGKLLDGTVFDSSVERGEPAEFPVGGVIPGWTEALLMMKEGAKYELYIPSALAYGKRGAGQQIPPNATLQFEVELLEVKEAN